MNTPTKRTLLLALFASSLVLTGCASNSRYEWNGYRHNMFTYAEQKITNEQMLEALLKTVELSQTNGRKVAPGIYAEIGTFYLRAGNKAEAVKYYDLEAAEWPESKDFMTKLSETLRNQK